MNSKATRSTHSQGLTVPSLVRKHTARGYRAVSFSFKISFKPNDSNYGIPRFLDPSGFRDLTKYLYGRYKLPIYCTENGFAVMNENSMPLLDALNDTDRVDYYNGVVNAMLEAIDDGVEMKAYFPWSAYLCLRFLSCLG